MRRKQKQQVRDLQQNVPSLGGKRDATLFRLCFSKKKNDPDSCLKTVTICGHQLLRIPPDDIMKMVTEGFFPFAVLWGWQHGIQSLRVVSRTKAGSWTAKYTSRRGTTQAARVDLNWQRQDNDLPARGAEGLTTAAQQLHRPPILESQIEAAIQESLVYLESAQKIQLHRANKRQLHTWLATLR